jgi:hypothetical protein
MNNFLKAQGRDFFKCATAKPSFSYEKLFENQVRDFFKCATAKPPFSYNFLKTQGRDFVK